MPSSDPLPRPMPFWSRLLSGLPRSSTALLALFALQYVVVQLLTMPLFGDSARNLHWGILTAEQPGFLLGEVDTYERIKGFPPDPVDLSADKLYLRPQTGLHPWWGPLVPVLFAFVWKLTHSYLLLQLVIPVAGGIAVVLVYLLACDLYGPRIGMLATAFLACFPLFRQFASVAYIEPFSMLVLTAAFLAYLRGRTLVTVLLGTLAILTKLDLSLLYAGPIAVCVSYSLIRREQRGIGTGGLLRPSHHLAALFGPLLFASPWIWQHYLRGGSGGPTTGLSGGLFLLVAPQMLQLLFYIPWYGALVTLLAIGVCVVVAVRNPRVPPLAMIALLSWLVLGLLVVLAYAATPGAGNSPRVFLPALPPLALLFADGYARLEPRWRRRIGFYLLVLFGLINSATIVYDALGAGELHEYRPVWEQLHQRPRGFVLTETYWETILYARQPATWFEFDESFQRNIMQNAASFAHYVEYNPIRYVVLPADGDLASDGVRSYLDTHAQRSSAGAYLVYELPK